MSGLAEDNEEDEDDEDESEDQVSLVTTLPCCGTNHGILVRAIFV